MRSLVLTGAFAVCVCLCRAQSGPVLEQEQYRNEAIVWEHLDTTITLRADGTGERTIHVVARLQSEGAARQFSVIPVAFASAYETAKIEYVRVRKPDGSVVETPIADTLEMPAPVTTEAPLYSDLKVKQLPVRSLGAGDVIDYQFRVVRTKAEAPGKFWGIEHFLTDQGVILSQTLTLHVPADTFVQVWHPNHPTTATKQDGVLTYRWSTSQLTPTSPATSDSQQTAGKIVDPDEDEDGRKLPSVAWTTFHTWAEVGEWYRSLELSRSEPTPPVTSRANELTKDAKTPEDQVRALYDFVSTHTRYVGIDFGVGHYQPHAAAEVMANQYGDCKDKDTLLEALLRAKGFSPAPVLIGVNIAPVDDLPSPALFNHVITTVDLPTGLIWLDTTPEAEPFRVLVPQIRDEKALVIPAEGTASLQRTPADPPFRYFERFEAVGSLDKDGLLKSHMDLTMRSDSEFGFRILLQRAAPAQWDEAIQAVSRAMGFAGTVNNADLRQKEQAGPMHLSYDYTRPSFADWDNHRILPLFPALEITYIDSDKAPEHDIDQGSPRRLEAATRIKLPEGYSAELPDAIHVKRDYATFDQTYRVDKGELVVERTVVITKKKVAKADWKDYAAYLKATGVQTGENYIALQQPLPGVPSLSKIENSQTAEGAKPAAAAEYEAKRTMLRAMMKGAYDLEQEGKWDAARALLEQVRQQNEHQPGLMSMLGYIARHEQKPEEAIEDYEAELRQHKDDSSPIVTQLAFLYISQKRYADAEALLKGYLERNDVILFTALAYAQQQSGDDAAALKTLQDALATHPHDGTIEEPLAAALHRAHRDKEAAAMAKNVLMASKDASTLNSAAYLLSQMKLELPLAEAGSRRAVEMLETALAQIDIQHANENAVTKTNLLAASWDTLGWIYFQEDKPAQAEPYVHAAWLNWPSVSMGDHLAQVMEAMHKPAAALALDEIALTAEDVASNAEVSAEVKRNLGRLHESRAGTSQGGPVATFEGARTFKIKNDGNISGLGTFRLAIAEDGIEDLNLIDGPEAMRALTSEIDHLKLPGVIPAGSKAHVFHQGTLICAAGAVTCDLTVETPGSKTARHEGKAPEN